MPNSLKNNDSAACYTHISRFFFALTLTVRLRLLDTHKFAQCLQSSNSVLTASATC